MGAVFRAHDVRLDRPCALKLIKKELGADESFIQRFQREARAAARFRHRSAVEIYATGEDEGLHYIALELVTGRELSAVIKAEGPLAIPRAVAIAAEVARA